MSDGMTLEQIPEALRGLAKVIRQHGTCAPMALEKLAADMDAHLSQPAQAVDVGAIDSVIVDLEERARNGGDAFPDELEGWADALTRAIHASPTSDKQP